MVVLDVVIVGAGWAGLAAARTLKKSSTHFEILEARNYIGGRSFTSYRFGHDCPIEVGSAWIHGVKHNPIQTLLRNFNLPSEKCHEDSSLELDETGEEIKDSEERRWQKLRKGFMSYMKRRQDDDDYDVSLEQVVRDYLASKRIPLESRDGRGLRTLLEGEISYEYAAPLSEMSLYWWDVDEEFSGGDSYLSVGPGTGYSKAVSKYAEDVEQHVRLETKVTKIVYDEDAAGLVTIHCVHAATGEPLSTVLARHAIVNLPLGVLKHTEVVQFSPPLPRVKLRAIQGLGFALFNKVMLCWDSDRMGQGFPPESIRGQEWISQMIFPDGDELPLRIREFYNPATLWSRAKQRQGRYFTLIGFCYGEDAMRIETMTDDEVTEAAVQSLRGMFDTVPFPSHSMVTRWASDPYARGSYSFQKVGTSNGNKSRRDLASCVCGKLWFAGEACHVKFPGTTHGALLSGEATGKTVIKAMR